MSESCKEEKTHVGSTANFDERVTNIYGLYQIHVLLQIPCNRIQEVLSELLQLTPHYKMKFQHIKWHITPNATICN